ncbi:MAG: cyclase family protein [Clostridiaceae bacterium]|nr:cyclase family protein [Clostridiaceae bacterium]
MRIIDLSIPITNSTNVFPGDSSPEIRSSRADDDNYMISTIKLGSHTGTHIDAPLHAIVDGSGLGVQPVDSYVGETLIIDLHDAEAGTIIDIELIESVWNNYQDIKRIVLRTDWHKRCSEEPELDYFADYPALDLQLADWLIAKGIVFVGLESPSISATDHMRIHRRLLSANIVILESMINVELINKPVVELHAVPMNIPGIDGSPVRAYAIER